MTPNQHQSRDRIVNEIEHGGSESPCPVCGLPRLKRSDYIRCSRCGINWLEGEDRNHHPAVERMRKMIIMAQKLQPPKKPPATVVIAPPPGAERRRPS